MTHPYFDPLGETEPHTTPYKLLVLYSAPRFAPFSSILSLLCSDTSTRHKTITLKSMYFPLSMRCEHVQGAARECRAGCYVREAGQWGRGRGRWWCKSVGCEGHGWLIEGEGEGEVCFGKKGQRLVRVWGRG
jgi:hypothetical protein